MIIIIHNEAHYNIDNRLCRVVICQHLQLQTRQRLANNGIYHHLT